MFSPFSSDLVVLAAISYSERGRTHPYPQEELPNRNGPEHFTKNASSFIVNLVTLYIGNMSLPSFSSVTTSYVEIQHIQSGALAEAVRHALNVLACDSVPLLHVNNYSMFELFPY